MKRASTYLISIIFTLLLIFTSLAAMAAGVVRYCALNSDTALSVVASQNLAARVHTALETEFRQRESTTGIPTDLYTDAISEEALEPIIRDTVSNGFSYLRGETASLGVSPDFSALSEKLRTFFAEYADAQGIEQDDNYESALQSTITDAEETICTACDVFRFGALNEAGLFQKAKRFVPWAGAAALALIAVTVLLGAVLFGINHRESELGCYWCATALLIASLLLLIPAAWLQQTRWFDRFSVKTDQTFAAVTGYLYANTHAMIVTAIFGMIAAVLLYVLFCLLHLRRKKREIVKKAKH